MDLQDKTSGQRTRELVLGGSGDRKSRPRAVCPEQGLPLRSLSTCWGRQPVSQRAMGLLGLKDKGRQGQGKELVAGSLMALKKKKHKIGELWGDINRAVRH